MKRFVLVLLLVAVAGATVVAAAPGSQTTAGPTAKQFRALKKEVTALKAQVKFAKQYEFGLADFLLTCMVHAPIPVDSVGDGTNGYLFGAPGTPPASATSTSALTLGTAGSSAYEFFTVRQDNQDCVDFINTISGRHALKRIGAFRHH